MRLRVNKDKKYNIAKQWNLRNNASGWLLMLPLIVVMYLKVWRPTVMGVVWSFFRMKGFTPVEFIGLQNYIEVIRDTQFWPVMGNTVEYVILSLIVGFIPPIIIAIFLNEMIHFKNAFRVIIYLPVLIPGIAAMLIWYFIYFPDETGLLNMLLGKFGIEPYGWLNDGRFTKLFIIIHMTWKGFAGTMLLYLASLQSIPLELYEAAVIDGASPWKRLWNVTRPQISGTLILTFINQIIGVFQIMQEPMAMTGGGPNGASISIGYQLYKYGFVSGRTGHAMALGVIIFIALIWLTLLYFKLQKKIEDNYL